jgi:hypothetical protein
VLVSSFSGIEAHLSHSEDSTLWHALGERCRQARGAREIRDVSIALGIPQYRLRAVERGLLREVRVDLAQRYFRFLGIDEWVADWCRANRELAIRVGLLDATRTVAPPLIHVDETHRKAHRMGRGHAALFRRRDRRSTGRDPRTCAGVTTA